MRDFFGIGVEGFEAQATLQTGFQGPCKHKLLPQHPQPLSSSIFCECTQGPP